MALPKGIESGAITHHRTHYENVKTTAPLTPELFERALQEFCMHAKTAFSISYNWLDQKPPGNNFYDLSQQSERSIFVQKIELPTQSSVIFHGDLHGDVHALVNSIAPYVNNQFKLVDPNVFMVFLGDYVDRGLYGYECIYTLLRLKNANPSQIFFARGNHEDRTISSMYGFTQELVHKNISDDIREKIFNWYDLLPAAIYVGCNNNFLHCSHGCVELSYNPHRLLNSQAHYERIPNLTCSNGFMWNDVHVDPHAPTIHGRAHGCLCLSKNDTHLQLHKASFGKAQLRGVFRAHQHSGQMMQRILGQDNEDNHGVAKLWTKDSKTGNRIWDGIVVTFNVCPDTPYGLLYNFSYDTQGILTLAEKFDDWRLEVKRIQS